LFPPLYIRLPVYKIAVGKSVTSSIVESAENKKPGLRKRGRAMPDGLSGAGTSAHLMDVVTQMQKRQLLFTVGAGYRSPIVSQFAREFPPR
jgi:hypothetical protein